MGRSVSQSIAVVLVSAVLFLVATSSVAWAAEQPVTLTVYIDGYGVANVTLELQAGEGVNVVPLPVEPDPATIAVALAGKAIDYVYGEGVVSFVADRSGPCTITYIANTSATGEGALVLLVNATLVFTLMVDKNVIIQGISPPESLLGFNASSDYVNMTLQGPVEITYLPLVPATTTTTTAQTTTTATGTGTATTTTTNTATTTTTQPGATTTTTSPGTGTTTTTTGQQTGTAPATSSPGTGASSSTTTTSTAAGTPTGTATSTAQPTTPSTPGASGTATSPSRAGQEPLVAALTAAGVVVVVAVAILYWLRRGRREASGGGVDEPVVGTGYEIDDTDKAILRKLVEHGGSEYQSVVQKELGLPKTTMWRRVKRLEQLGYLEVEKTPRGNLLRITRRGEELVGGRGEE